MKSNPNAIDFQKTILWIGFLFILIAPFLIIFKLSKSSQSIYAVICAIVCFLVFYFTNKKSYKHSERINTAISYLFWCGLGEVIVAIFFWTISHPWRLIASLAIGLNYAFSFMGYFSAFFILFTSLFPQAGSTSKRDRK